MDTLLLYVHYACVILLFPPSFFLFDSINFSFYFDYTENNIECTRSLFFLLFLWFTDFFSSISVLPYIYIYTKTNEKFKYFLMQFFSEISYILRASNVNCDWLCKVFCLKKYVWIKLNSFNSGFVITFTHQINSLEVSNCTSLQMQFHYVCCFIFFIYIYFCCYFLCVGDR